MKTYSARPIRQLGQRLVSNACAWLTVSLLTALAVPTRSFAQVPTFNTAIVTPTGSQPWQPPRAAAVGDFNGDGKLDAFIVDGSPAIRFMRGNGDGTFTRTDIGVAPITSSNVVNLSPGFLPYLPHGVDGYVIARAADVNGDGKLDAVCVMVVHLNYAPITFITVMINQGNDANGMPQFAATHYSLNAYDFRSLTVGDLNSDGKADFIVGGAYGQVLVYLNNGDGTFTASQTTTVMPNVGGSVGLGVIADVNGDGKADFVVTDNQAAATDVFFGNGDGTLQAPVVLPRNGSIAVAVADLNKDGKPDVIEGYVDGTVSVALNNGNGTFGSPNSYSTVANGGVSGFFISDVNGDGNLDVALSLVYAGKLAILLGNGDGTFGAPNLYNGIPNAMDLTLADFTNDGKPDIASVSANGYGGQNFYLLTNTTVFAPPLPTQTLTILGGNGSFGAIAANVEYFNPATGIWQPAYLVGTHPWGEVTGTNSWINYRPSLSSDPGAGPTTNQTLWYLYRVRFTVPSDAVNPHMTFSINADNFSQVAINSVTTGGTQQFINNATMDNVIVGGANHQNTQFNADAVFSQSVHAGENTITVNVGDWGGANGFNFRIDLSMQSSQPLEIVPAAPADTTPPLITAPVSIIQEATGPDGAVVNFTATAVDNVDGPVNVVATPASGSTFAIGTTPVGLAASDAAGNTATGSFTVTVQDTTPPVISGVPANITAEATSANGASVSFASATATDIVDGSVAVTASPGSGSTFALGTTTVTLTATDAHHNTATSSFTVTVVDTTPPVIASVRPSTGTLWPPNHQMVPITVSVTATDNTGVTSLKIISVTSSEPDNGLGDGDTANDIQITGNLTVSLRAERSGNGNGRTYTITVEARDAYGNASTSTCTVFVPKSQGKGK